jgi:DNA-binding NtrC family response regulator
MESSQQPVIFVVEDTNGESCISDLSKRPSVIVLDYNLDGQMNGLDTLQRVRDFDPNVYVILFSSQKGLNTKEIFLQYGSFDFLEKNSLSLRTLRQMVNCVTSGGDKTVEN